MSSARVEFALQVANVLATPTASTQRIYTPLSSVSAPSLAIKKLACVDVHAVIQNVLLTMGLFNALYLRVMSLETLATMKLQIVSTTTAVAAIHMPLTRPVTRSARFQPMMLVLLMLLTIPLAAA